MWFHKRFNFFAMLSDHAALADQGLKLLVDFMQHPTKALGEKVEAIEQEADNHRRELIQALHRTFITPFDREDVFALSRVIDDMVDYANTTVEEMLLFNITPDEAMRHMAESLYQGAQQIRLAVDSLPRMNGATYDHIIRAKKFENQMEHLYREGLVELFKSPDIVEILKKREIYRHLSNAADRGDEAADIISDILIKNA